MNNPTDIGRGAALAGIDFQAFIEGAPYGVFLSDEQGRYLYANRAASELTGYLIAEITSLSIADLIPEESRQAALAHFSRLLAHGASSGEVKLLRRDGEVRWMSVEAVRLSENRFLGYARDVTEQVLAREELRRRQELYQSYIENAHEAIYCTEFDSPIDTSLPVEAQIDAMYENAYMGECNRSMALMYGIGSPGEFKGRRLIEFHGGKDNPINRATFRRFIEGGYRSRDQETVEIGADGERRCFVSNDTGIVEGGRLLRIWGSAAEVTQIKNAARALEESEKKYRLLAENSYDVIWLMDAVEQRFLYISPSIRRTAGFEPDEVVGHSLAEMLTERSYADAAAKIARRIPEFLSGQHANVPFINIVEQLRKDGTTFLSETSTYLTHEEGSGRIIIVGVSRDVSERVKAEEERNLLATKLAMAQKMEALGRLAGGIAHDFNNILGSILGFTELTMSALREDSEERENLQEVLVASYHARELVRQVLAFSRQSERRMVPVEIGAVAVEAVRLLGAVTPKTISFEHHLENPSGLVLADPSEVHQIILNLCTNAQQAIGPNVGTIRIALTETSLDRAKAESLGVEPGDYVKLSVEDDGPGMDEFTKARIFEPYFTTKQLSKGTGLGLAIVHGIVASMGGAITVESAPGSGTTFCVFLPKHSASLDLQPSRPIEADARRGGGNVLFVDDEASLARLGKKILEKLGYSVTSTTNSAEAMSIFLSDPEAFDIIVTDQTMPNITGSDLIRQAKEARPRIRTVICTGHSDVIDAERAEKLGIDAFIRKPYDINSLGTAISTILHSP